MADAHSPGAHAFTGGSHSLTPLTLPAALPAPSLPQSETSALAASWDPFQDDETGVAAYSYQVGLKEGGAF